MTRLDIITLHNAFQGKLIIREFENHVTVNTNLVGNSKFKSWYNRNLLPFEYVGGNNYKSYV